MVLITTFVEAVMTWPVDTIRPDAPVKQAVQMMMNSRFGCLPVVDENGELVGMLSEYDLIKLLDSMLTAEGHALQSAGRAVQGSPRVAEHPSERLNK